MSKRLYLLLIALILGGCSLSEWTSQQLNDHLLAGSAYIISPNLRYVAELSRIPYFSDYYGFSGFSVFDTQTNSRYYQSIEDVPAPSSALSGISFAWTPSANYIVVVTDVISSSHGCDEMFVYTGDGRTLVFNTGTTTTLCRGITADAGLSVLALCPNDDIVYTGYRLTPSTGDYVALNRDDPYCPDAG